MTNTVWQAFYFKGSDNAHAPARTELIEAKSEDEAAKIAASHMGSCKRVDITTPRWEEPHCRVILVDEDRSE